MCKYSLALSLESPLFLEYTASSFYTTGGREKILVSYTNDTKIFGFPNSEHHPVISKNQGETTHRMNFIMQCIKFEIQTLR